MMSLAPRHLFVVAIVSTLLAAPAWAQTSTWTGLGPDNNWTTAGNWDGGVPSSGSTAIFNGPGNGNINISLGGTMQSINTLLIDTPSAAAYTLGQLPGDALSFASGGLLVIDASVTNPQVIDATLMVNGDLVARNSVSNGGASVGNGLVGLTLDSVNIAGGTLFLNNGGATVTTAINGNITDSPGQPGSLSLLSATGGGAANINSNFIINGNNTYTGGTTIQANTGTNGSIQIGTDMPFGPGKVTNVFQGNSVEWKALNGTRTIPNDIDIDGGINFVGSNSFVLAGSMYIKSSTSRTLLNKMTISGVTLTLGAAPGSSNVYLGNPTSNGGDGAGRTLILSANSGATTVINTLIQDVNPGDSNSAVQFGSGIGGTIIINTAQTYTSPTKIGSGQITVQFHHDYNVGGPSGPFGLGTLYSNGSNNAQLAPTGGGTRTLANPILMEFGITVTNIPGDNSSVMFTGPITFTSNADRLIQNKMHSTTGGILTLGSAANPSTFTLASTSTTGPVTLTFATTGRTIINDTIQDSPGAPLTNIAVSNTATTTFNGPQNTNGDFTITGSGSTVIFNGDRSGAGNITLAARGAKLLINGTKTGSGAVTISPDAVLGGTGNIAGNVTNNGTIAPGSGIGTLTMTNNVTMGANSNLAVELFGTAADKLVVGGNLDLSNVDSLNVTGNGNGSSWIIATYAGTLAGIFDNVTSGFSVDYGTGSNSQITLMALVDDLPGDWNDDGKVDAADYVTWRKNPSSSGGDPGGYNTWRQNFGRSAGSGALNADVVVPEPTSLLILLTVTGLPAACARRRNATIMGR
jgi:fibronectin-binding autotransporter adhesin